MFISKEQIKSKTGVDITATVLALAQTMIETYVGKDEAEVERAEDAETLGRAVLFQALYINDDPTAVFEQAAVVQIQGNEAMTTFDTSKFSPFMSPWAVKACEKLSWLGSRSIHTGPVFDYARPLGWEYE
jgi:hypothetical protein